MLHELLRRPRVEVDVGVGCLVPLAIASAALVGARVLSAVTGGRVSSKTETQIGRDSSARPLFPIGYEAPRPIRNSAPQPITPGAPVSVPLRSPVIRQPVQRGTLVSHSSTHLQHAAALTAAKGYV